MIDPLQAARISLKLYGEKETEAALGKVYGLSPRAIGQIMQQCNAENN